MDVVEQTEQAEPIEAPEPMPVLSVADHAAQFGKEAMKEAAALDTAPPNETPEEKIVREQKRDNKTGQYREGKVRHRAASQQARPEDVPRIQKLTAEKNTEKERADRAEAELATLKRNHAPAAQIARAEAKVEAAQPGGDDPEPQETDAKFGGDYGKFLRAAAGWDLRQQQRTERQQQQEAQTKQTRAEQDRVILKNFSDRVNTARAKYADFDAVALGETPIREGSAVDAWITEHKAGPDVLYYLHQTAHRQELESLLTKPIIEQLDDLTLLAQRLLPPSSSAAGSTSAAPGRPLQVVLPHRPPTLVRTEAQRTGDAPPPTDGSLSVAEHERAFGRKRR